MIFKAYFEARSAVAFIGECLKSLIFRHCERSEANQSVDFQWIASG